MDLHNLRESDETQLQNIAKPSSAQRKRMKCRNDDGNNDVATANAVQLGNTQEGTDARNARNKRKKNVHSVGNNGETVRPNPKRAKYEKKPDESIRFDQIAHFPDKTVNWTFCKTGCGFKTNLRCKKCDVHLCIMSDRNCYEDFHVLKKPSNSPDD